MRDSSIAAKNWWKALRPHHWIKSGFCLAALFFSGSANDLNSWIRVLPLLVAFSGLSSASYLFNDLLNKKEDLLHPRKRYRPIASGILRPAQVIKVSCLLVVLSLGLLFFYYDQGVLQRYAFWLGLGYIIQNLAYSTIIRNIAILDVLVLGVGFLFRVASGAVVLDLVPTSWLLGSTYFVALMMAFGKRLGEFRLMMAQGKAIGETRTSLRYYREGVLKILVSATCVGSAAFYAIYCFSNRESILLQVSIVPVCVGLMSYLRLAWRSAQVEVPENLILKEPTISVSIVIWLIIIVLVGIF